MGKDNELLEASRSGNAVLVEKILSQKFKRGGPLASLRRGPGVNVQDANGYSALHHAALNGHRDIAVLLLQNEASPNITDSTGSSALHLAAWAGHTDIVRVILTNPVRNVQVNLTNKHQETALHCGAQYGHSSVVNLLLEHGSDPGIRNLKDETPLDLAALYGRLEAVELLLRTHPELASVYKSSNSMSKTLYKVTPLHAASRNGHRGVVDALLRAGLPPSLRTPAGTPLHEAALCGKVDVVRRLLESGIDLNITDFSGKSALQIAQQIHTPVAQEIAALIQAASMEKLSCYEMSSESSPLPPSSVPSSPYETAFQPQSRGDSTFQAATESYVTLPRRSHSRVSARSQCSDSSVYEIPPPPRSLPWLQNERDGKESHSSYGDLLQVDLGGRLEDDSLMSRSFDERSSADLMSLSTISCPPCEANYANNNDAARRSPFSRASQARHSVDHYLPMTKVSPTPPQKPPRKALVLPQKFNTVGRGQRSRQTVHGSCSGYELVYLARTGSRDEAQQQQQHQQPPVKSSFRIQSQYVDMATSQGQRQGQSQGQGRRYENVGPAEAEDLYDIPRDLGGYKTYENVARINDVTGVATPTSPSHIVQPPTPDHPPPPASQAEISIHQKMRPLSSELKRKSRDIETETEEEIFVTYANVSGTPGSGSVSLSLSDNSTDNIEEVSGDKPYAGLMRGAIPVGRTLERPRTLENSGEEVKVARRMTSSNTTILSPFDEQEEWAKISEILGNDLKFVDEMQREIQNRFDNLGDDKNRNVEDLVDIVIGRTETVSDWLLSLGMPQYLSQFLAAGFDDIDFLGDGILDDSVLQEMSITDESHRSSLLAAAERLSTPLAKIKSCDFSSVDDWLRALRLECYCDNFRKNRYTDMDRVQRVWECELTTVLEILKPGHLRRILSSLTRASPPQSTKTERRKTDMGQLTSDLQKISTNIEKLGNEIAQKMESCENTKNTKNTATGTMGRRKSRPAPAPPTLASDTRRISDLVIREPSELVLGMSKALTTQWRHAPKALVESVICYEAQYLGSTLVKVLQGCESTKRSIDKLKKKHSNRGVKSVAIILGISHSGVKFLEPRTQEPVCQHDIRNIQCACQDADDLTHFAYITEDHNTQDHFCHVFRVSSMDLATEIILTLGQAFEVAYQLTLRDSNHEQERLAKPAVPKKPTLGVTALARDSVPASAQDRSVPATNINSAENQTAVVKKPVREDSVPALSKPNVPASQAASNSHSRSQSVTLESLETAKSLSKSSSASSVTGRAPLATKDEL